MAFFRCFRTAPAGLFLQLHMQDVRVLEGYEFDGVWCDELVPQEFIDALEYRLVTRRGETADYFHARRRLHAPRWGVAWPGPRYYRDKPVARFCRTR